MRAKGWISWNNKETKIETRPKIKELLLIWMEIVDNWLVGYSKEESLKESQSTHTLSH